MKRIPDGYVPIITDETVQKEQDKTKQKIKKMRENMSKHGVVGAEESE
jgi:hypothetical protein